jgi:hypothetical protein
MPIRQLALPSAKMRVFSSHETLRREACSEQVCRINPTTSARVYCSGGSRPRAFAQDGATPFRVRCLHSTEVLRRLPTDSINHRPERTGVYYPVINSDPY